MQVIAEEPWDWFLFEDGGKLYLDVLIEHGAISFNVTAALNEEQADDYAREGLACLMQLAGEMRHKALTRQWCAPSLPSEWSQRSISAVHEWRKNQNEK
jgi:hypothetical protein